MRITRAVKLADPTLLRTQAYADGPRINGQDGAYEEFADQLTRAAAELHLGNGFEACVSMVPLIDLPADNGVMELPEDAVNEGVRLSLAGTRGEQEHTSVEATVLADVTPQMRVRQLEIKCLCMGGIDQ